jgi:hypothetical protein
MDKSATFLYGFDDVCHFGNLDVDDKFVAVEGRDELVLLAMILKV